MPKRIYTLTREAWAAHSYIKKDYDAFIKDLAFWHGENNPDLPHKDCKLKAEGFAEGILALPKADMNIQGMWKDYKELNQSGETNDDD